MIAHSLTYSLTHLHLLVFPPHFTGVASSSDYRRGLGGRPQTRSFTVRNEHSKWLRYNNPTTGSAYYCNEELGVCSFTPPEEGILADGTLGALVQLLQHRLLIDAPQLTRCLKDLTCFACHGLFYSRSGAGVLGLCDPLFDANAAGRQGWLVRSRTGSAARFLLRILRGECFPVVLHRCRRRDDLGPV